MSATLRGDSVDLDGMTNTERLEHYEALGFDFLCQPESNWSDEEPELAEWVVEQVVPKGLSVLWGRPSVGKSFVAFDWAFSVATGQPWLGRYPVQQTRVIYILAEGSPQKRKAAWKKEHGWLGRKVDVTFVDPSPNFADPREVEAFVFNVSLENVRPGLFVLDTLANAMGGDENSAQSMSSFVNGFKGMCQAFGADGIILHHPGHDGVRERGSSALRGHVDSMLELKVVGAVKDSRNVELVLKSVKPPRDGRPLESLELRRVEVSLENSPEQAQKALAATNTQLQKVGLPLLDSAQANTSCVIRPNTREVGDVDKSSDRKELIAWRALARFGDLGATRKDWEPTSGVTGGSFDRVVKKLKNQALIRTEGPRSRLRYIAVQLGTEPAQGV